MAGIASLAVALGADGNLPEKFRALVSEKAITQQRLLNLPRCFSLAVAHYGIESLLAFQLVGVLNAKPLIKLLLCAV